MGDVSVYSRSTRRTRPHGGMVVDGYVIKRSGVTMISFKSEKMC